MSSGISSDITGNKQAVVTGMNQAGANEASFNRG
jgi:hypothetical protein